MAYKSFLLPKYHDFLYERFQIIKEFCILHYVNDYLEFKEELAKTKKERYNSDEKYIIFQVDEAFYLPELPYSLTMYNLIITFIHLDIPLSTVILFTNTFSNSKEIDSLLDSLNIHISDRPIIIESFCTQVHINKSYNNVDIAINDVTQNAVSMMGGTNRPHRNALYNFLSENNLLDKVAVSISPPT